MSLNGTKLTFSLVGLMICLKKEHNKRLTLVNLIKEAGIEFDQATLQYWNAIKTTNLGPWSLTNCSSSWKSWRLNERHYGGLTGKTKLKLLEQFGMSKVHIWRRSYDGLLPPNMDRDESIQHTSTVVTLHLTTPVIPDAENLSDFGTCPSILGRQNCSST